MNRKKQTTRQEDINIDMRKFQSEITSLKNLVDEMMHSVEEGLTSRVKEAKDRFSELEDELHYTFIQQKNLEKSFKSNKQKLRKILKINKEQLKAEINLTETGVIGFPERRRGGGGNGTVKSQQSKTSMLRSIWN